MGVFRAAAHCGWVPGMGNPQRYAAFRPLWCVQWGWEVTGKGPLLLPGFCLPELCPSCLARSCMPCPPALGQARLDQSPSGAGPPGAGARGLFLCSVPSPHPPQSRGKHLHLFFPVVFFFFF